MNLLLIQGANMEYLGKRQPELYGTTTAAELNAMLLQEANQRDVVLEIRYTNLEGEAISWIYDAERRGIDGLLINPAGFLYAGFALRDCLRGVKLPAIEIHMTNIERRGMHSVTAEAALGMIIGFGIGSYVVALDAMVRHVSQARTSDS
jgi:3-dehydroquinate dehydratase II